MRQTILLSACLTGAILVAGCTQDDGAATVERAFQDVNVVDESNLNDIMLTAAAPNEAVNHFSRTLATHPDRIDLQRGLAQSLVRAKRYREAAPAWQRATTLKGAGPQDSVNYADALIRTGDWDQAAEVLGGIVPTYESFNRYRLEAMIADSREDWERSDSFYKTAVSLTTTPAKVLNNWGFSKLSRGAYKDAERLFNESIREDPQLFTAKNNLVLARGAQRAYSLPVIPMTQTERAQLLHTLALSAIKQGDVRIGKGLLHDAIETHPQHFDAAVRALDALEAA